MKPVIFITIICSILSMATAAQAAEQRSDLGSVTGGNVNIASAIIDKKCTACHSKDKIDIALSLGKDMSMIQMEMEKRGAALSSNEREVLGIFWKQSKPIMKK